MSFQHIPDHVRHPGRDRVAPAAPSSYNQSLASEIQRRLDEASLVQEDLREQRQKLLIQREKIRSASNQLRAQRVKTGDAEATFMTALRQFFTERREDFPPKLNDAYGHVEAARDELGAMEEDYLQAESTLSGLEWTFTGKESDVYQFDFHELFASLNSPPPAEPSAIASDVHGNYEMAKAELRDSQEQFKYLREEQSKHINLHNLPGVRDPEAVYASTASLHVSSQSEYFQVLDRIMASEVKVQKLKQLPPDQISMLVDRRMSDPVYSRTHAPNPFEEHARARTESAVQALSNDPYTQRKIEEWVLDCLSNNPIQRKIYIEPENMVGGQQPPDDSRIDQQGRYSEHVDEVVDNAIGFSPASSKSWDSFMEYVNRQPSHDHLGSNIAPSHPTPTKAEAEEQGSDEKQISGLRADTPPSPSIPMNQPEAYVQQFPVTIPTVTFEPVPLPLDYLLDAAHEHQQYSHLSIRQQLPLRHRSDDPARFIGPSFREDDSRVRTTRTETREDSLSPYQHSNPSRGFTVRRSSPDLAIQSHSHFHQETIAPSDAPSPTLSIRVSYLPSHRSRSKCSVELNTNHRLQEKRHGRAHSTSGIFQGQYLI